ncbi:MAG: hypothetical protein RL557_288, partial [archaeon]
SQGCLFHCDFCGAQTKRQESFYNTEGNLRAIAEKAKEYFVRIFGGVL